MNGSILLKTMVPVAVAALLLAGCATGLQQTIVGSGKRVTVDKELAGFSKLDASSAFRVDVAQSEDYGVSVTVDEKVVPYLDVTVQGDTLRIAIKPGLTFTGATGPLDAKVTMPRLAGLTLSGASRATLRGFSSGDRFDAKLSGASRLDGDITSGDVAFEVSGASRMTLAGQGGKLGLEVSGASQADLEAFPVSDASVNLSGASRATVNTSGVLDADVSGASTLRYTGSPTMGSVKSSGASTIQPR